ncbi:MAG TPA: hypothetical protein VKB38_08745 [Terracidiphilus sp.]|nr:hypothetical protein [Terracidiphilus sp.]
MSKYLLAFVALASFAASLAGAQDAYTGNYMSSSQAGSRQTQFNIRITKYSSADEVKQYGAILKEKGQSGLLDALKQLDNGRINAQGDTGTQIAIAEKWQNGTQTVITMISCRRILTRELKSGGISDKYPFSFMQITVDANGKGHGKMVQAASLTYDEKKGGPKLEPYGQGATRISNVEPIK